MQFPGFRGKCAGSSQPERWERGEGKCIPRHTTMINVEEQLNVEVPTHLFRFEERVVGMTITQLMIDTTAGAGIWGLWSVTTWLPQWARIAICVIAALLTILVVHVHIRGYSLVEWGSLYAFYWLTPAKTIWYSEATPTVLAAKKQKPPAHPSVQSSWIQLSAIQDSCLIFAGEKSKKGKPPAPDRYSAVLEVTGINIQLLSLAERARIFGAYQTFLAGLEFPLQIITSNETVDVQAYQPLQLLQRQLSRLQSTPRLAAMARSHLQFLRKKLGTNIVTRHYVVISASPLEEEVKRVDGKPYSGFLLAFAFFRRKKQDTFSQEQTLRQLRVRLKVVRDGFRDIGLQTHLLDDEALARFYASSLTPGVVASCGEHAFDAQGSLSIAPARAEPEPAKMPGDEVSYLEEVAL